MNLFFFVQLTIPVLSRLICIHYLRHSSPKPTTQLTTFNYRLLNFVWSQEFSTDVDFRQTWVDYRLEFPANQSGGNDDPVYIPEKNIDQFWIPDLYFPNEKHGVTHQITIPNRSIRIYPNGTVRYFCR